MKEFSIIRSFLDQKVRKLVIDKSGILFENSDLRNAELLRIVEDDIVGFRYGINFIRGFKFYIGREYQIFIETKGGKDLKIKFNTFYSYQLNKKHQLYLDIIDELWNVIFDEFVQNKFNYWKSYKNLEIQQFKFDHTGLYLNKKFIEWYQISVANYHHYYVIYSKENPDLNIMINYRKDRNSVIIWSLIEHILKYLNKK